MPGVLARARALYEDAHQADVAERFDDALEGFRALLDLLDGADLGPALSPDHRAGAALRVRALLGIARARYESTGDLRGAMAAVDGAERYALAGGLEPEAFAVQGERGRLLLRSGDVEAALAAFDTVLRGADVPPTRDLAVALLHHGSLHLDYGDPRRADADLRASAEVAVRLGERDLEAMARHRLGLLRFVQGDLPAALRAMGEAARIGGTPEPVALLDKARVLADAGLVGDAVEALEQAAVMVRDGSLLVRAEVELTLAACLMDLRRHDEAVEAARAAAAAFARCGNALWAARAQVAMLEALLGADRWMRSRVPRATLRRRAERALALADGADGRGSSGGVADRMAVVYPALLAAAEWCALAGDLTAARAYLARVPADLGTAPLSLRLGRPAVVARIAFAAGHRSAGVRAVQHGQRMLAAHRGLGSVEAAAASGVHAMRLNLVDTQAALATGDPAAVFDALERGRAAAAGAARVVPPDDPELAMLLEQARAAHQAALALGPTSTPEGLRAKRQHLVQARRLQDRARERSWQVEGERRPVRPTTARELRAALRGLAAHGGAPVVASYVSIGSRVLAVRLDGGGQRLLRLGERAEIDELVRRTRADLAVVANSLIPQRLRAAAAASLRHALGALDALLVVPLDAPGDLHVAARGGLLTLPWCALPSRSGLRTWVGDRVDLRTGGGAGAARPGGVVVLAGPGTDGAVREARAVAAVWPGSSLHTGAGATTRVALDALAKARVVHLAAHGGHVEDNALFSSLRLADGPLFAHELDGLDLADAVVVLSACELGLSVSDVGGEALGFASVLLRHGARAVVAAVAPLRDDLAVRVMPRLHEGLRAGLPPGAALAAATRSERDPVPLVCFGPLPV
ncbi:CHAT domain-containing protein [Xylanimonas allomyrinae]|uniref:CHAT domain-containing protein n=1 Tax=Xylanimonas allomyrinae TaxID=2509459 RepID=A0A4V0YEJ4_9MICO|nr:CHAT domain-containing protein [Xylanimonas allomyrinae]QAY64421.1 CHAT domain-containing protein [Xylanimonas allomyrinae]